MFRNTILSVVVSCCSMTIMPDQGQAQITQKPILPLAGAKQIMQVAEENAISKGASVVIAIVDDGGNLLMLQRLDGTQVASVAVAMDKARTAAIYRRPSRDFETQVTEGRASAMQLSGAVALAGGIPIRYSGHVVGAVGVSGETPKIDEDIAIVAAARAQKFDAVHKESIDNKSSLSNASRGDAQAR